MVVSKAKDSKRKRRKESPPAQQPTAVESSPEMPKRTKVQAQRKFAQGQSAPTSSYNSVIAASSSSNTGPSTSSESRDPPTEILPNKRPKTEDFLTFLCYRGTNELPPHLDYLNQGKPKDRDPPVRKIVPKPVKAVKKGKKGKPKAAAAAAKAEEPQPSTSAVVAPTIAENIKAEFAAAEVEENPTTTSKLNAVENGETTENPVIPFAVRKRAEVVTEGNRRGRANDRQLRHTSDLEKCNNTQESKRRSNRTNAKDVKPQLEQETDEEEYFSANDDDMKLEDIQKPLANDLRTSESKAKSKTPIPQERNTETPSKESEKSRKSRASSAAKRTKDALKENVINAGKTEESPNLMQKHEQPVKEKPPVKRTRQKESPIFIPSPEPSGRMTRQRAFFEPVKVLHHDEPEQKETETEKPTEATDKKHVVKKDTESKSEKIEAKEKVLKATKSITASESVLKEDKAETQSDPAAESKTIEIEKNKNLNVFDFSSDDEQPLAKSIKLKRGKASPKKAAGGRNNKQGKKTTPKKAAEKQIEIKTVAVAPVVNVETKANDEVANVNVEKAAELIVAETKGEEPKTDDVVKSKNKRGKNIKKKAAVDVLEEDSELAPPSPKKTTNARQSRKKTKAESQAINGGEDGPDTSPNAPIRNQRPSRKTKEAAAIYMGIIGHKLQLPDDEDDDNSLNSFPDLPNVKEMEKMENELKKNAVHQVATTKTDVIPSPSATKPLSKQPITVAEAPVSVEKPTTGRRGRPPKLGKQLPIKREIEGMLVKKGALTKIAATTDVAQTKEKSEVSKVDSEDEDFLLNEEVNETKRKLEKSFSDSDDEPLAIKASVKTSDKDAELPEARTLDLVQNLPVTAAATPTTLTMLPFTAKAVPTPPLAAVAPAASASPITTSQPGTAATGNSQAPSPFKTSEKKSPVPTSKILHVPATYGIPAPNVVAPNTLNMAFNKTTSYISQPSPHYHTVPHIRPPPTTHQFPVTAKSPTAPVPPPPVVAHLTAPLPPQSPLKYQTPPTTYPPPIEAYPSPKINPNFLTPKFDRTSLPRNNNFPSPSPVRFDVSSTTSKAGIIGNSTLSPKTPLVGMGVSVTTAAAATTLSLTATSTAVPAAAVAAAAAAAAANSSDPLKDEIGSILAANLMPSKEESGKIFGIASVSLAQSSGPDNTKCTLGKCGSIHKPVLGPVVPTEGYIGDQLSSKERRKAKVNMTHEQIQKWLIECSSNPDEIQDDLEDDFDDNIRPNLFATTPPPTRDDKESTSFSSSSKATRDLGKSESAWSAKGPSLKATPVVATTSRKDETKQLDTQNQLEAASDNDKSGQAINLTQKSSVKPSFGSNEGKASTLKEKTEKKGDKKVRDDKSAIKEAVASRDNNKQHKADKEREKELQSVAAKATVAGKQSTATADQHAAAAETTTTPKQNKRKNVATAPTAATTDKSSAANSPKGTMCSPSSTNVAGSKSAKRTPVYNQKTQKQIELRETTTTSHRKAAPFSYSAFSVENEKSIYSFDKDDDEAAATKALAKPTFRRQSRQDSHADEVVPTTPPTSRTSPTKKRAAAAAAEKANKDMANASQNSSVSLTLSPAENCKLVKVSLEGEKAVAAKSAAAAAKAAKATKKTEAAPPPTDANDSDSDGHTFYIPLQGAGTGGDGDGGIQGVAVKLGREGPDGPNQKVIMHATLVTKAQMGSNSKPLPESMNVSDIVKTLMTTTPAAGAVAAMTEPATKKGAHTSNVTPSTSAAAAAAAAAAAIAATAANTASNKSVPVGTVQPRFKAADAAAMSNPQPTSSTAAAAAIGAGAAATGSGLVRVNSNSSLFSGSAKSRIGVVAPPVHTVNKKFKDDTPIKMSNNTAFPRHDDPTQMVEAPIFRPTEKEFADPIEFIERITPIAARFGICKIIPPATFKPECRISDEMRFTAYNQYVHKMLYRWGPSTKELSAIRKYLATQSIVMNHPPWIGGMEVDLPRLYHTVQELGGLKEVIEKKKWSRVAEDMCIPKLAQDRVTKLDDIYCKYLLPYDTLSPAERQKLFDEVEADWAKREARARRNADRFVNTESVSNEEDDVSSEDDEESEEEVDGVSMECIVKGRSMPLSQFYRIARNTMALWFKNTEPTVNEVEAEFWRHVAVRDSHVCVHAGSIDSSGWGYGFPSPGPKGKGSNYARHPWNLKVLTNNPGSVLRSLGPVMGVTVPTLHVGMLFSACCWYRDPHGLSWIEYLHTGASKLWYGIPDDQSANFRAALTSLIPTHCQNKTIWLPCDTVMVPPHMLTDRGVSLCRIEQKPGEFIVVFPRAYTSSLATGYVVSESVYFATTSWLDLAKDDFRDIHDSCEPAMFSLEQLLFALGYDQRVTSDTLQQMLPMLLEVFEKEVAAREQLKAAGVTSTEKVLNEKGAKAKKQQPPYKSIESECDLCRANLYISMVRTEEGSIYCLQHALKNLNNGNIQAKQCKLIYAYNVEDVENLIKNLKEKIQQKRGAVVHKKAK